jgi:dTDP-4-amino-4,6-dideoxy-D-galactose acyltransferase
MEPLVLSPAVAGQVEQLPWDSEFFGFSIGRVSLEEATAESLREVDEQARALSIECLYGSLDRIETTAAYVAQQCGHRLVEVAMRFGRPAVPFTPRPTESTVRRGTPDDLPRLRDAIATLAPWSRFAADPRFGPDAAERMFGAWVARAAEDGEEHMLLISEADGEVTGLSTNVRTPIPRVDLMGVLGQGSGSSWALMAGLVEWADGAAIEAGPCAARNIAPLRFLEHCGFSIVASQYRFHRWLDEPPGP